MCSCIDSIDCAFVVSIFHLILDILGVISGIAGLGLGIPLAVAYGFVPPLLIAFLLFTTNVLHLASSVALMAGTRKRDSGMILVFLLVHSFFISVGMGFMFTMIAEMSEGRMIGDTDLFAMAVKENVEIHPEKGLEMFDSAPKLIGAIQITTLVIGWFFTAVYIYTWILVFTAWKELRRGLY